MSLFLQHSNQETVTRLLCAITLHTKKTVTLLLSVNLIAPQIITKTSPVVID